MVIIVLIRTQNLSQEQRFVTFHIIILGRNSLINQLDRKILDLGTNLSDE